MSLPYSGTKQTKNGLLPLRNVDSYIKTMLVTQSDSTITYGTFDKKSPFLQEELNVPFENNNNFLIQHLKRSLKYRTGKISL